MANKKVHNFTDKQLIEALNSLNVIGVTPLPEAKAAAIRIEQLQGQRDDLLRILKKGAEVLSGLEADCDNAKIEAREARLWLQDADEVISKCKTKREQNDQ